MAVPVEVWLSDRFLPLLYKLARADEISQELSEVLFAYASRDPVRLEADIRGDREFCRLASVAPPPPRIGLLFGDAIQQLRSCLDHAVLMVLEEVRGRALDANEARNTEFPVCRTSATFRRWTKRRSEMLPELSEGSLLYQRLAALQPFAAQQIDADVAVPIHDESRQLFTTPMDSDGTPLVEHHPLLGLAAWSNEDKHRRLSVAFVRPVFPRIVPVPGFPGGESAYQWHVPAGAALEPGMDIFSVEWGTRMVVDLYPYPSIRRPETGLWRPILPELNLYQRYVAELTLPFLLTGARDAAPLPSQASTVVPLGSAAQAGMLPAGYYWRSAAQQAAAAAALAASNNRNEEMTRRFYPR
ncbi:hypothetical protein [Blastococcus sp. LR1]|uniref:hypothetical protein n=1 Tax=Blastococcus sp. LR1 TaxID=2877000 RepID=UPI001CCD3CD0|nr:hypothetical protein [Blastococcus sp. LR1]MCA0144926.1 hypothetical protein [Blastococcus sp. LR1]